MPFTPAHPAIVLPFLKINKRFLSATGLVVGSLVPDIESYLRMDAWARHSHSIESVFLIDIPAAVVVAILFHQVVKRNFIGNLPFFLQSRLEPVRNFKFIPYLRQNPVAFLLAVVLGAASHLFWDSFTHADGFFVSRLSFYNGYVPFENVKYPMYYALQYISSYIGLFVVALYVIFMKRYDVPGLIKPAPLYWTLLLLISGVIVYLRFALVAGRVSMDNVTVSCISAACCACIVLGIFRFNETPV